MVAVAIPSPRLADVLVHLARRPISIVDEVTSFRQYQQSVGLKNLINDFVSRTSQMLEAAERDTDRWIAKGRDLRKELWQRALDGQDGADELEAYARLIVLVDSENKQFEAEIERLTKIFQKQQKEAASISRTAGSALSQLDKRLFSHLKRELDDRVEFALFLRALRAQIDPASRGGPTFDNPKALKRYLMRSMG